MVKPNACGIGGDAFWLTWDAATGRQAALNGSGCAGSRADAAFLRASGLTQLPFRGPLAITVPGAVRSWGDAHRAGGRLSRDAILAPAIELARAGFPAWDGFIEAVEWTAPVAASLGDAGAGFAPVFRPHGRPWRPGERVRLPALAATLETLARDGFDAYYDGDLGDRQGRFLDDVGAFVTRADLAGAPVDAGRADRHRLSRRPRHEPPAQQQRRGRARAASDCWRGSSRRPRRRSARPASPMPSGSTWASRRRRSRWPTATRFVSDPAFTGDVVGTLLDPGRLRRAGGAHRPASRGRSPRRHQPVRRRDDLPGDRRRATATR